MAARTRVAVFPIPPIGHVHPLLAVTTALAARDDVAEVRGFGPPALAEPFARAGASYDPLPSSEPAPVRADAEPGPSALALRSFLDPLHTMWECLERAADFAPTVVLYDVFCVYGFVVAQALGLPSASLVPMPGYGALGEEFWHQHAGSHPLLDEANDQYRDRFGVDILGRGMLPVLFPSPDLSVITAQESLSRPLTPDGTPRLHDLLGATVDTHRFVGPCVGGPRLEPGPARDERAESVDDPLHPHRRRSPSFPFALLDRARAEGRRIVLFSLGTVLTDFRFSSPVGGAPTGRAFLRRMLRRLLAAFAGDPEILVIVATGSLLSEAHEPAWPENFVVREFVPQKSLLERYADVFITHHGMNSTAESILSGVPMVSVPGAGDQIPNAETALAAGVAVAPWDVRDPYGTCGTTALRWAVHQALRDPALRTACAALAERLRTAGGAREAGRLVAGLNREASTRPKTTPRRAA